MRKAIVIKGRSDSGKSTLLNTFYDWLIATHPVIVHKIFRAGDTQAEIQIGLLNIAFDSCGDEGHYVDKFLTNAKSRSFDIIICACRRKGSTNDAVKAHLTYPDFIIDYVYMHPVPTASITGFQLLKFEELKAHIIGLPKI